MITIFERAVTVKKLNIFKKNERVIFICLCLLGILAIVNYAVWWFDIAHIAINSFRFTSANFGLFFLLSFVIWHGLIQRMAIWFIIFSMRKPQFVSPSDGKKVALLTCFVPGKEPYYLLENTLKAMRNVTYPHDSWILDEGDDPYVKNLCEKYDAHHFSRKDIKKYNQLSGPFKAKTKAGNHNAWRDKHEDAYDFVAQMDMDHIPHKDYLDRILGYFRDEKVAFVVGPQIYANQHNWISRGAAEQAHIFHGPIQQGFFKYDMPLFIGTNHAYRPKAMQEVNGYASTIVEDHLTGMRMYAKGWKGVYVPEIIADGEGPGNWTEYLNQQMRWSYGIFEILFKHTPFLLSKLTWPQRINFLAAQTYYLTGLASMVGIFLTCFYLMFGVSAANFDLNEWILHALPPFTISFFIQYWSQRFYLDPKTESGHHLRGMLLSLGALPIYALAFFYVVTGRKLQYLVTKKGANPEHITVPLQTFVPHIIIVLVSFASLVIGTLKGNQAIQLQFWAIFNIVLFSFIIASSRDYSESFRSVLQTLYIHRTRVALTSVLFITVLIAVMLNQSWIQSPSIALADEKIVSEENRVYLGAVGKNSLYNLDTLEKNTGKDVRILGKYQSWGDKYNSFDFSWAKEVSKQNSILMVTWEPWDPSIVYQRERQKKYELKHIIDGKFDAYITQYAKDVKKWKRPIFLRFAHEMNGDWYPWSPVNSNSPNEYKKAWIHVYKIFEKEGATNVTWVWSPNEPYSDVNNEYATNTDVFYPGDEYVDWVGFSAFNWGTSSKYTEWRTFKEIASPAYALLIDYNKPIMVSEINSVNVGGDKNEWVRQMNEDLFQFPQIKAVIWYKSDDNLFNFDFSNNTFTNLF